MVLRPPGGGHGPTQKVGAVNLAQGFPDFSAPEAIKPLVPNIKFAYSVSRRSVPESAANSLTGYYPGDKFVDVVGVSGTSLGTETWDQVFSAALRTLSQYHKPLWILSEATVQNKAQFIEDTFEGAKKYHLAGFLYFNQKGGDGDWLLDASATAALKRLTE